MMNAAVIVNDETLNTRELENPCQLYKFIKEVKDTLPETARVKVTLDDGTVYKDLVMKRLANGTTMMMNIAPTPLTEKGTFKKARAYGKVMHMEGEEVIEEHEDIENECQMYKFVNAHKDEFTTNTKLVIHDADGNVIKTLGVKMTMFEVK